MADRGADVAGENGQVVVLVVLDKALVTAKSKDRAILVQTVFALDNDK